MEEIYIVESVCEVDAGFLPDERRIKRVFSSRELAEEYCRKNKVSYEELEINKWEIDEDDA